MKRYSLSLFFLSALILGLSFAVMRGGVAWAIPSSQADCDFDEVSTTSFVPAQVPNSIVSVNNGFLARTCIIQFSSQGGTFPTSEQIRIRYSVDGGACTSFGPEEHLFPSNIIDTLTNISVLDLGPGKHTIQPCFSRSGGAGAPPTAILQNRCLTVECRTW